MLRPHRQHVLKITSSKTDMLTLLHVRILQLCSILVYIAAVVLCEYTSADDHSRVRLQEISDQPCSDYINANHLDVSLTLSSHWM